MSARQKKRQTKARRRRDRFLAAAEALGAHGAIYDYGHVAGVAVAGVASDGELVRAGVRNLGMGGIFKCDPVWLAGVMVRNARHFLQQTIARYEKGLTPRTPPAPEPAPPASG